MNPEYYSTLELKRSNLKRLALLFANVFGAPPWNEVWRCPECNRFYGPEDSKGTASPCCSIPLIVAYPENETVDYISKELSQPLAKLESVSRKNGQLEAFAWGYQFKDVYVFAQKKWPQSEELQAKVVAAIGKYTQPESPFYYLSEVGVSPPSRGNGIGLSLTSSLIGYGLEKGLPVIFRTNWASPMMRIAARLDMIQIMGLRINVVNNQIIKTGEIAEFIDEINQDRTLFIKLP